MELIVAIVVFIKCIQQILGPDAQVYLTKVNKVIFKLEMFSLEA